jgi:hypothetical protein
VSGPRASDRLVIEELDGEGLVYDLSTHRAHCIEPLALRVLRRANGRRSPRRLAAELGVDERAVRSALVGLAQAGLVRGPRVDLGRRRALRRLAIGAAAATPVVFSIIAPRVAEAASAVPCVPFGACKKQGDCCGTPGSPALTCNGGLMCGNNGVPGACKDKICQ